MGVFRNAAAWIGLVNYDRFDEQPTDDSSVSLFEKDDTEMDSRPESERIADLPPRIEPAPAPAPAIRAPYLFKPRSFNEVRSVSERLIDGVVIVLSVSNLPKGDDRRVVDFCCGLASGVQGAIERFSEDVFLVLPRGCVLGQGERERLTEDHFRQIG